MKKSRRNFIKASVAAGVAGLSDVSAEAKGKQGKKKEREVWHHPRAKIATPLPTKVAVISSIGYQGSSLQTNFESGATAMLPGITFDTPRENLNYYKRKLHDAVVAADNDDKIGLIVTAGGFVAWDAALFTATKKPFISMIGGQFPSLPSPSSTGNFWGAVDLQSFSGNTERINYLGGAHGSGLTFKASEITLFYNPNSRMAGLELRAWTGGPVVAGGVNSSTEDNETAAISTAFDTITTKAVIISADPFFNHNRGEIITAANAFIAKNPTVNYVCYPTQHYKSGTKGGNPVKPTKDRGVLYGPDLDDAYKTLGTMAGRILKNQSSDLIVPATMAIVPVTT